MPFNSRDMWVYLKAQDLATRALNSFSRSVGNAGKSVALAQAEADRAAEQSLLTQQKLLSAAKQQEIQSINNRKAAINYALSQAQNMGLTQAEIDQLENEKVALEGSRVQRLAEKEAIDQQVLAHQNNIAAMDDNVTHIKQFDDETERARQRTVAFSNTMQSLSQTMQAAGFAVSAVGVAGVLAFADAAKAAIDYQQQVRLTSTQIDNFSGNFKQLEDIGLKVSDTIAVKFGEVQTALYDIFSSMDVSIPQAQDLLTAFAKAAVAGQTDIQSVSRGTIGIMNAFNLPVSDINRLLDIQFKLVEKGVGTYDEWIGRIGKVSPSAIRAGQTVETMAAALEASTRFGIPAAQSATAVARAFDAFSNPKAVAGLKAIGVNALDAKGNFRPFLDVMKDFKDVLDKLPGGQEAKINAILTAFKGAGSTIDARKFLQDLLLVNGNIELMGSLLQDTTNSAGALNQAYGTMADTTQNKIQLLTNKFDHLKVTVGEAVLPTITQLVDELQRLVDKFDALDPKSQQHIINMARIGTETALVVGPLSLVVGWMAQFAAAIATAGPEILIVVGVLAALALVIWGAIEAIKAFKQHGGPMADLVHGIGKGFEYLWQQAKTAGTEIKDAYDKYMSPAVKGLKQALDGLLTLAIQFFGKFFKDHKKDIEEVKNTLVQLVTQGFHAVGMVINTMLIPALHQLERVWHDHQDQLRPIIDLIEWLAKQSIKGFLIATLTVLISTVMGIIAAIALFINIVSGIVTGISIFIRWLKEAWDWLGRLQGKFNEAKIQFEVFFTKLIESVNHTADKFGEVENKIKNAFLDAAKWLVDAGVKVIQGLWDGIQSMLSWLGDKLSSVGDFIKNHKGPPSKDAKLLYKNGQLIIQGLIDGMNSMTPELNRNLDNVSANLQASVLPNGAAPATYNNQNTNNVNVYVTTQEISPQYHAAQLGMLLGARV